MFDIFKDVYLESQGKDPEAARKIKEEKKEMKKLGLGIYIFSKQMKFLIISLGIIYLSMISSYIGGIKENIIPILINYGITITLDIIICISLIFGKKRGEIISLVSIILFIAVNYLMLFI